PHESRDGPRRHDLGRDEQAADAGGGHHLGLAELRTGDAERPRRDLAPRDLRTLVGLRVRANRLADPADVSGHALEIALEAIEVEEQRGSRDLVPGHGRISYRALGGVTDLLMFCCWIPEITS